MPPTRRYLKYFALLLVLFGESRSFTADGPSRETTFSLRRQLLSRTSPTRLERTQKYSSYHSPTLLRSARLPRFSNSGWNTTATTDKPLKWKRVLKPKTTEEDNKTHTSAALAAATVHDDIAKADRMVVASTTVAGILALFWLLSVSGSGAWRYYLAGGICAAASHAIPVPVDVVKTRKQVDPELCKMHFLAATKEIIRRDGLKALMAGLGPTVWGYMLEGAIKFGVYEVLKPIMRSFLTRLAALSTVTTFLKADFICFISCAAISGLAAALVLCPMEALRIRLVSESNFAPKGWIEGFFKILKYEGVFGLWKGVVPMIFKQVPYTITKNVSFDFMTRFAYTTPLIQDMGMTVTTKFSVPFFSALMASILSCISSQPGDMVLSLVNAHGGRRGTTDIVRDILRSDRGIRGFFVGIKTRFLHVGIIVTLQLLIYDFVKQLCGIAATGSV